MKKNIILAFLLLSFAASFAQTSAILDRTPPKGADMPSWANLLYERPINMHRIQKAMDEYYAKNIFVKNRYTRYYKQLYKVVELYIQPDGSVKFPTEAQLKQIATNFNVAQRRVKVATSSAKQWSIVGPKNITVNQYPTQSSNACIRSIDVAPTNANILYCGTETGSIFKSVDKGLSWQGLEGFYSNTSIIAIAIDPLDANVVYISDEYNMYKTSDGGNTWANISVIQNIMDIHVHPQKNNILIFTCPQGVYRSTNATQANITFEKIISPNTSSRFIDIEQVPNDPSSIYVGGTDNDKPVIYKSTDEGKTFVKINLPAGLSANAIRLAVTPANPNKIYMAISGDNGVVFCKASFSNSNKLTYTWETKTPLNIRNPHGYFWGGLFTFSMAVSPINENLVSVATLELAYYDGTTWKYLPFQQQLHGDIQELRPTGNGGDIWAATDGGVAYCHNFFERFENRSTGLYDSELLGFAQGWNQDILIGGRQHNGTMILFEGYPNGLQQGKKFEGAEESTGYVLHGRPNWVASSTSQVQKGIAYNILEGTTNNFQVPSNDLFNRGPQPHIQFLIDPLYTSIYYRVNGTTLDVSENYGVDYRPIKDFGQSIVTIAQGRDNPNVFYALTFDGLFKTTNKTMWTKIPINTTNGINNMTIDLWNSNNIWVSGLFGISQSKDGGGTWTNIALPVGYQIPGSWPIAHQAGTDGGIFALMQDGNYNTKAFYRDNTMATWQEYGTGLPPNIRPVRALPFYRDGKLRIGTNRGIWEIPLADNSQPLAQPSISSKNQYTDTEITLEDYSALKHTGATWNWTFPGASSVKNNNTPRPSVVYNTPGLYDVQLEVKDATGKSHTKLIKQMVSTSIQTTPTIVIDAPLPNATISQRVNVKANATDKQGDALTVVFSWTQTVGAGIPNEIKRFTTPPYEFVWETGTLVGNFELFAQVYETNNPSSQSYSQRIPITIITAPNTAPVVNITAPAANPSVLQNSTLSISANATDNTGVSKVEFYLTKGTDTPVLLGTDTNSPYQINWSVGTTVAGTDYTLTAKAYDNATPSLSTTSLAVPIKITAPVPNTPPVVNITAPLADASVSQNTSVTVKATATDNTGVSKVELYLTKGTGTPVLLKTDTSTPFEFSWSVGSTVAGTDYKLTAKAYDNAIPSLSTTSLAVPIKITAPNSLPTAALSIDKTTILRKQTVTLKATATDSDGSISKVEFYDGTTLLHTDATSPYEFAWVVPNTAALGSHTLTAKSYDNLQGTKVSSSKTLKVNNNEPAVKFNTPLANSTHLINANVAIVIESSDIDGTISKVEFKQSGKTVQTDNSPPYSFIWKAPATKGTYKLIATTYDSDGAKTESTISVKVVTSASGRKSADSTFVEDSGTDVQVDEVVTVMPNPADDYIQVLSQEAIEEVLVVDMSGRRLIQTKSTFIKTNTLNNNTYYYVLVKLSSGNTHTKKVLIMR